MWEMKCAVATSAVHLRQKIKPFLLGIPRSPVSAESRKAEKYIPNMFSPSLHRPTYFTTTKKRQRW